MIEIKVGDSREMLRGMGDESVQCCVTSPPYWGLRDYGLPASVWCGGRGCEHEWGEYERPGMSGGTASEKVQIKGADNFQIVAPSTQAFCQLCGAWRGSLGLEPTPELYVEHLVEIFREVRRVLRDDGVLWLNLGDSYASSPPGNKGNWTPKQASNAGSLDHKGTLAPGLKPKDLVGIPWRVAFALQADGWWLRSDIIWHKPNCMPESVTDRPTKAHEYVFLLSKSARYFYDGDAIREPLTDATIERSKYRWQRTQDGGGSEPSMKGYDYGAQDFGDMHVNPAGRNRRTVWTVAENHHPLFAYLLANLASDNPEYLDELLDRYSDDITLKKDIWTVPTHSFKGSHFATFPPALIEPMIKAGTSERGCCAECGAPWERVVDYKGECEPQRVGGPKTQAGIYSSVNRAGGFYPENKNTIDWQPACACGVDVDSGALDPNTGAGIDVRQPFEPIPCTVLDPFAGACTVGLVADRLQRDAILIELNPEYAQMGEKRIRDDGGFFVDITMTQGDSSGKRSIHEGREDQGREDQGCVEGECGGDDAVAVGTGAGDETGCKVRQSVSLFGQAWGDGE